MNTLTKHAAPFELKALDESARTFQGLASTWDEDLGGDIIHRGAFRRTLDHWERSGKALPLIDQHNYGSIRSVIGKLEHAEETDAGLLTEWQVIEGQDGDEALRRIKGGFIDSMSIGYEAVRFDFEEAGEEDGPTKTLRHLREVKLMEVSLVIWPMNPGATIDGSTLKAMLTGMTPELKEEIRALLTDEPPAEPPAPATEGLAPEAEKALREQILRLQLRRLTSRAQRTGTPAETTDDNDNRG